MKVAYNNCFGGFGLSPLATTEFAKKKGFSLTWYEQTGYKHDGNEEYKRIGGIPKEDGFSIYPLTKDYGENIVTLPEGSFYYPDFYGNKERSDPHLIEIIEKFGEDANGMYAKLAIKEIPDGADFEITEYDGNENVVPPRMSW